MWIWKSASYNLFNQCCRWSSQISCSLVPLETSKQPHIGGWVGRFFFFFGFTKTVITWSTIQFFQNKYYIMKQLVSAHILRYIFFEKKIMPILDIFTRFTCHLWHLQKFGRLTLKSAPYILSGWFLCLHSWNIRKIAGTLFRKQPKTSTQPLWLSKG
jgi:hypothetical protein